jgi:hypothetical protein
MFSARRRWSLSITYRSQAQEEKMAIPAECYLFCSSFPPSDRTFFIPDSIGLHSYIVCFLSANGDQRKVISVVITTSFLKYINTKWVKRWLGGKVGCVSAEANLESWLITRKRQDGASRLVQDSIRITEQCIRRGMAYLWTFRSFEICNW